MAAAPSSAGRSAAPGVAPAEPAVLRRALSTGVLAAVGSSVAAVVVATVAKAAGVQHVRQLEPAALVALTVVGVAVGTAVWVLVARRAAEPVPTLRRLVTVVLVLSFVPDLVLGLGSASWGAAVTLALAHVAVFAVTVALLGRQLRPGTLGGGRPA